MADTEGVREIRDRVDRLLATRHDEVYGKVRECIAESLGIDAARVAPHVSLVDELGAESLDFLDLVFRLETEYRVKIPRDGILVTAREGLAGRFDRGGVLSSDALERLRVLMPEVQRDRFAPGLRIHEVPNLFTPETFVRLVAWRLAEE
jgi:acyl carrier protein